MSKNFPYTFKWGNNQKRASLKGRHLKILARCNKLPKTWTGKPKDFNSRLVEFKNGQREIISGNALRRLPCKDQTEWEKCTSSA